MTTPTPEQLREAAGHLAKAVAVERPEHWPADEAEPWRISYWHVVNAFDMWDPYQDWAPADAIGHLYDEREWQDNQQGLRELTRAYSGWLLLEALRQEKPTLDETRADSWRELAAWKSAWATLVDELLAGASPAPAASE